MTMLTNCAKCKHIQPIDLAQLRSYRGMMRCENCLSMFDALEYLREVNEATASTPEPENIETGDFRESTDNENTFAWEAPSTDNSSNKWHRIGLIIAGLTFAGQIAYFNTSKLLTAPSNRSIFEKICHTLNCKLPTYQNPDEFLILQGLLTPIANNNISFKTAISNQAEFDQSYPKLKLTLLDFAGNAFAQRVFLPQEYLQPHTAPIIAAKATMEISLQIAATKNEIGGYNFDLIN